MPLLFSCARSGLDWIVNYGLNVDKFAKALLAQFASVARLLDTAERKSGM
jgi:hypothetical protein